MDAVIAALTYLAAGLAAILTLIGAAAASARRSARRRGW